MGDDKYQRLGDKSTTVNEYRNWASFVKLQLEDLNLWDIVVGTTLKPVRGDVAHRGVTVDSTPAVPVVPIGGEAIAGPAATIGANVEDYAERLAAWIRNDRTARMFILKNVNQKSEIYSSIRDGKDAFTIWLTIEVQYVPQNKGRLFTIWSELIRTKQDQQSVVKYSNSIRSLVTDLNDVFATMALEDGEEWNNWWLKKTMAVTFLFGLDDESFDHFKSGQTTQDDREWDFDKLVAAAQNYESLYAAKKSQTNEEDASALASSSNYRGAYRARARASNRGRGGGGDPARRPYTGNCFACGKQGHKAYQCREKVVDEAATAAEGSDSDVSAAYMSTEVNPGESLWIVDSGCTNHMTGTIDLLKNVKSLLTPKMIKGIGNTVLTATKYGVLEGCIILDDNNSTGSTINNVWYVENLGRNLLSARQLALDSGEDVKFSRNKVTLTTAKDASPITIMMKTALSIYSPAATSSGMHGVDSPTSTFKSHIRQDWGSPRSSSAWEGVAVWKLRCSKKQQSRALYPGDVIHSDVFFMSKASYGGRTMGVTFIDDCTRFAWVYPLKKKSDVFEVIKDFFQLFETQFGKKIKKLHTDNGGEYINEKMKTYMKKKGLVHWVTTPHTPQQNGVAERFNKTLGGMTRSLLFEAKLAPVWWAEAIRTAVYLNNRLATKALSNKTPYEALYNKKPDVSHVRVFGCVAFRHIPGELRKKLDKRAARGIFMGYDGDDANQEFKGYRFWDPVC
ncbi:hypothetical protein SmJEL517_g02365 [Synchytrium microbalum]|uniref:Uncharacterized protein n=1 Tax=Synchytrium microbalum TaxID=1806994 RepID=A0A507CC69_9FUNG|nr:uncharacterized protein SmJEL517_g02365 [Synchytrium microbalum]TPX35143.1 hypothetical protein SmJEL517_g02365 [Synchytrium microbalum]